MAAGHGLTSSGLQQQQLSFLQLAKLQVHLFPAKLPAKLLARHYN
jgi:hypothetical protein